MKAGRVTLATTAGPELWTAEVDPLAVHVTRQGDELSIALDWSRETDTGRRRGTLVLRLEAGAAIPLTGQLVAQTSAEMHRRARDAAAARAR